MKISPNVPATTPAVEPRRVWIVPPMPEQYQIVMTRSIFSRQGIAKGRREADGVKAEELEWVLRGVAMQEGSWVAFIENTGKNRVLRLRGGERIARGRLSRISSAGVDYEAGGKMISVPIGSSLDGTPQPMMAAVAPATQESPDGQGGQASKKPRKSREGPAAEPVTALSVDDPTLKAR